jgi:AcrR family transcriptional regulator
MDRRQRKCRQAIFDAFAALLVQKNYSKITVQDIIDKADVGRTTFYAHFDTKEALLRELCEELFGHIIHVPEDCPHTKGQYPNGETIHSVFLHLLRHLQENDDGIATLLACENNGHFLRYFKAGLDNFIKLQYGDSFKKFNDIPQDFLVNHISGSFVEMVLWWLKNKQKYTPTELDYYFRTVMGPFL